MDVGLPPPPTALLDILCSMVALTTTRWGCLVRGAAMAGCSLLYNPDKLPKPATDAGIPLDQPTIVYPASLALEAAGPRILLEGQGTGGSRLAILAITGRDIGPDATVAL